MQELLDNLSLGFSSATQLESLWYCFVGVLLGTLLGVIPGIGSLAAMSMLFPFTFYLEPLHALIMLAGVYYGAEYGGSTSSILLNLPGTPSNAVTCLDGYPMAQQGRAGVALFVTTIASFVGGTMGVMIIMIFSPVIVAFAYSFGPYEYFSLMLLGLVSASTVSSASFTKSLSMVLLGIIFGLVGTDLYTGVERFTFGQIQLTDGVSIVALAMGVFGISDVAANLSRKETDNKNTSIALRSMVPTTEDLKAIRMPILRGGAIGAFFGALPGTGATIAAFVSYAYERRISRHPERFGSGAIEGISAPEAANNSAAQTAFIPTLTLGIPGSATMALILGILIIHGIAPGPSLVEEQPELFWGVIISFWIGNILLVALNIPLIGLFVSILRIPNFILYPAVLMFIAIGVTTFRNESFDVHLVAFFGLCGFLMRYSRLPAAPLLLGFVLGPMMEEHFRRAMLLSRGSLGEFIERPISGFILVITAIVLLRSTMKSVAAAVR